MSMNFPTPRVPVVELKEAKVPKDHWIYEFIGPVVGILAIEVSRWDCEFRFLCYNGVRSRWYLGEVVKTKNGDFYRKYHSTWPLYFQENARFSLRNTGVHLESYDPLMLKGAEGGDVEEVIELTKESKDVEK